eukprot:360763-Chlamydomonas_euryale.AAC.2
MWNKRSQQACKTSLRAPPSSAYCRCPPTPQNTQACARCPPPRCRCHSIGHQVAQNRTAHAIAAVATQFLRPAKGGGVSSTCALRMCGSSTLAPAHVVAGIETRLSKPAHVCT